MMTVALLRSIKQDIVPTIKLLDGKKEPIELSVDISCNVNCYAYALGILHPLHFGEFLNFCPGFTIDDADNWHKNILMSIETDLNALGIQHRLIPLDGQVRLESDEYLVKIFVHRALKDFHFARYYPSENIWFHKEGNAQPERMCVHDMVENSAFGCEPKFYHFGEYLPKGYIAIKEPT